MNNILSEYDYILLDFSSLFAELNDSLVRGINSANNVLTAPTFDCECKQIQKAVPHRIITRYMNNKANISVGISNVCKKYGILDTFGLANRLCHDASVLVIEANYSLEDRIVLSGIGVDVYSLLEDRLIRCTCFFTESKSRTIDKSKTPLSYSKVTVGDAVYTENGQYVLGETLEGGAEAQIYKVVNNHKVLAKIYKEDEDGNFVLTSQKLNNINILKEINDNWDVPWLALPTSVVYADPTFKKPIGYMMKYFEETKFLSDNLLFNCGNISVKFSEYNETAIKDVLDFCIKFVRQILFLALNDIHISDYNDKNFAVPIKSDSQIIMVDTDSYCCEEYVSECMTYSGCLSKKYECNTRLDLIDICDESLFAFIFTRLVLDSTFVPMRKSEFRFSACKMAAQSNPNINAKWNSIPKNLQTLFIDVFDKKNPPSINVLLYELEAARQQRFANTKYKDIYCDVLKMASAETDPSTLSKKGIWIYMLVAVGICMIIAVPTVIWRFGFEYPGIPTESSPLEHPIDTQSTESVSPQLKRYETNNGYYLSYSPSLDGYIEFYWDNGNSYKGDYLNGKRTGRGEYRWADGRMYTGDFVDDQLIGNGTYYEADGTKYVGSFQDGHMSGQGTLYDSSGNKVYEGGWGNGYFNGEGTYHFPNNGKYESVWEFGTCNGGEPVNLKFTETNEPAANGYWNANIFYGSYYDNGQWYDLP